MRIADELLARYPVISDQVTKEDIRLVLESLQIVLEHGIPGDIVELGCYVGTTSLFIRRLMDRLPEASDRVFHVYDSFEGLPEKTIADASITGTSFRAGELAVSKRQLVREFKRAGLQLPVIHKGWFDELNAGDIPANIALAFLDSDFYGSVLSSLKLVWPRLSAGGAVLVDDYGREALPGVERAVRDFFGGQQPRLRIMHNIAIIKS